MRIIELDGDLTQEAKDELEKSGSVAVDCEMMGLNPRRDRLCLVQMKTERGLPLVLRVQEDRGAPLLKEVFENPSVEKIFHYARIDTLFLKMRLGIDTKNVYCTKIASKLARTYTDRHGLKDLVREFTGESMDKSQQSSDWGSPDLSKEQVRYAAEDVRFLFPIQKKLDAILQREGRIDLSRKAFEHLTLLRELDENELTGIFEFS